MNIFWLSFKALEKDKLLKDIFKFDKQNIVFTPNPEILLKVKDNKEFKNTLEKATYLTIDGIWIYIAFQILDSKSKFIFINLLKLPLFIFNLFFRRKVLFKKYWERICGSDLTVDILDFANKNNIEITVIDLYTPQDNLKVSCQKKFLIQMKKYYKNLKINFYVYKNKEKDNIINKISKTNSKILFSTLGMEKQEKSVIQIMEKCKNIKLWLWVWSSFDYFTWFQKRPPKIFRNLWLEWFYRIFVSPNKIKRIKRIYRAVFVFTWEVLKEKEKV